MSITSKKVHHRSRVNFLPKYFGNGNVFLAMRVERSVFALADNMIEGYTENCGFWDFYSTSNNAGFMVPAMSGRVRVINTGNFSDETMSPIAAGLCMSILALNHTLGHPAFQGLYPRWEALMEYAKDHPESSKIMKILD